MFDYEAAHLNTLRPSLAECTVLLKYDGSFPLPQAGKIAAYGSGVRHTVKGGTGSGEVNSRYFDTVEQGLKNAGFEITSTQWLDQYDSIREKARKQFRKKVKAEAKETHTNIILYSMGKIMPEPEYILPLDAPGDAAIYVISRISGEGTDRTPINGDIKLTDTEKRDILELNRRFRHFMLVLNVGGVVDLSEVTQVRNILLLSQLGSDTGNVLADILLGKQNPSGKLATTWTAWDDYCSVGTFGEHNDTRYSEGIYVGYRYFDSVDKKALYPFGYGLSYTTFDYHIDSVELNSTTVTAAVTVSNTGNHAGKEIIQLYVSAPGGKLDKPYQDLAAFAKTELIAPGCRNSVKISFDMRDMASYDEGRSSYILESGKYILRIGTSSTNTKIAAAVELDQEAVVKKVRKICTDTDLTDWKPAKRALPEIPQTIEVLSLAAAAIQTETVDYDVTYPIEDRLRNLTDEQLAYAAIGEFSGSDSIIGQASIRVAGAAGETTSKLGDSNFPVMVMADGPAGLRLSQKFYRDQKGAHAVGQSGIPESIAEYLPLPMLWMMKIMGGSSKPPKNTSIEYQYATAIPIGTALAQSWNLEFARSCGDIVGDEMKRFGVHLWLAPALNIHRSIRCGRNFEYFSEDPLISGKFAAAITLGVQAHPGCGTTIKHYAANNQETNRFGSNSQISERALREIYLKGFEICVKEAKPLAVMTSYNLINGTHTAESRDLCEWVLRREFGFEGIIMTDWVVGGGVINSKDDKYPAVQPQRVAAAGGDLFMPGCTEDYNNVLDGLRNGSLSREQLLVNATRVYRMAKSLTCMLDR